MNNDATAPRCTECGSTDQPISVYKTGRIVLLCRKCRSNPTTSFQDTLHKGGNYKPPIKK